MMGDITTRQEEIQRVRVFEQVMSGALKLTEAGGLIRVMPFFLITFFLLKVFRRS